ncbi:MAG: hypothetical protein U5O15_00535 [Candidatus Krumholzibacteriota bacterium]|nr:hypothetical protein [Candidatus Krumholzibacteriota bacterium]
MEKSRTDVERVLATFSTHMEQKHSTPDKFIENIEGLLDLKRKREGEDYLRSLEKNVVYLHYFVEEAKAVLELMLRRVNDDEKFIRVDPGLTLSEIEERVREEITNEKKEISQIERFSEILKKESGAGKSYAERLEFNYSYLMAARSFTVDFINIIYALQKDYYVEGINSSTRENILRYIDMTANYYIGNVRVENGGQ